MAQPMDAKAYYGYLFEDNKKPTKLLDALLRGIANYIIENVGDKDVRVLSPTKLAAFYKAVGGNYDPLFVDVPHPSISYIFQAIGCQHTLQPTSNDFAPPSVPALTPRGFVRWEAIETLLGPEEHVPFLQTAVRTFAIRHPDTGEPFPIDLPTESFPTKPDPDVNKWHSECEERLRRQTNPEDYDLPHKPSLPTRPNVRSGYSHVRGHVSPTRSPRERQQGADYFSSKPLRFKHVPGGDGAGPAATRGSSYRPFLRPTDGAPQSPKLRRRSFPDSYYSPPAGGTPLSDAPQPTPADAQAPQEDRPRRHSHPRHRHSPSTTSSTSSSDTEAGSGGSEAACPKAAPCGETEGQPKRPASTIFVSVPPQASPIGTPHLSSPQRNHNLSVPRPQERTMPYKVPVDGSGNISAPFVRRVPVSAGPSRSSSVRWGSVEDMPDLQKRRASINTTISSADAADDEDWSRDRDRRRRAKGSGSESGSGSSRPRLHHARSGSHDGRYVARDRESERERRDRERDRFSDREEKEVERRRDREKERDRERSGRNPSPSKGMDWRRYIPEVLR